MSRTEIHGQIKDLKKQLKAENKKIDDELVRLAFVMLVLLLVAGYIYGKIQL